MYHMLVLFPRLLVMRMHNLHGTEKEQEDEESSDEESDEEEEDQDKKPLMELAMLPHYGGINRVRVCCVQITSGSEYIPTENLVHYIYLFTTMFLFKNVCPMCHFMS